MEGTKIYQAHYKLEEAISSGGFATIYKADERGRPETVAIKLATVTSSNGENKSIGKSLREEAKIIRRFDHNHIVRLYPIPHPAGRSEVFYAKAVEIVGNPDFFVMEYLSGGTFEDYLEGIDEPLSIEEVASVGFCVAKALHHIHKKGYAHNDLKLENIIFRKPVVAGKQFDPVLIDFGITTRVNLQVMAGSIYVMSPEQLQQTPMRQAPELQQQDLDIRKVDVWGMGIVMYRALGGRLPFSGRNERSMTQRIINNRPTSLCSLSNIPAELDELIIDGCLAKNPDHRLTMLELGKALRAFGEDAPAQQNAPEQNKKSGGSGLLGKLFG